jgi:hypothetical protein
MYYPEKKSERQGSVSDVGQEVIELDEDETLPSELKNDTKEDEGEMEVEVLDEEEKDEGEVEEVEGEKDEGEEKEADISLLPEPKASTPPHFTRKGVKRPLDDLQADISPSSNKKARMASQSVVSVPTTVPFVQQPSFSLHVDSAADVASLPHTDSVM